jgi:hypothetical protein
MLFVLWLVSVIMLFVLRCQIWYKFQIWWKFKFEGNSNLKYFNATDVIMLYLYDVQCFLNYYTRWVSIRSLLWSKLIVMRNVLQMNSKARVNISISKQVIFRPCLNESKKSLYLYSTYVVSIRSLTIYWIVLHILYFFGIKHAFIKKWKNEFKTWKWRNMLRMFLITPKWCLDVDLDVLPYHILKTRAHFAWNPSNSVRGSSLLWRPFHKIFRRPCS